MLRLAASVASLALPLAILAISRGSPGAADRPAHVPPPWAPCIDLPPADDPMTCESCGSNTNTINAFPINGLHPGGCWNSDNMRLVPGSLTPWLSACPNGVPLSLSFDGASKTLVGVDSSGTPRCSGQDLVGARFEVEAWVKLGDTWQARPASIMISQARAIRTGRAGSFVDHPAFGLSPGNDPSASLCDASEALPWRTSWLEDVGHEPPPSASPAVVPGPVIARVPVAHAAAQAIVVPGDVFDDRATPISGTSPRSGWFNLACASGGLAKLTLDGLEPEPYSLERRQAALKMLTGRYCKGKSHTLPGPMIRWVSHLEPEPADQRLSLEARWGKNGALCMSTSRLWRANTVIPVLAAWKRVCKDADDNPVPCTEQRFVTDVRAQCDPVIPPCDDVRSPDTLWTTYVLQELPDGD